RSFRSRRCPADRGGSADCPLGPRRQVCACSCFPRLMIDAQWNGEEKCRAAAQIRLDPQPSAMHFDDPLRHSKATPGAAFGFGMRTLGLLEFLKNLGLIGLRN